MLVSKSKAAKLAGVSRTTIHRYAKDGKLSMSGDKVDTSELLRVFGEISEQSATPVTMDRNGQRVTGGGQGDVQGVNSLLLSQIEDIKKDRDHWRNKADELVELLKLEQENTKLLTHQSKGGEKTKTAEVVAVAILGVIFLIAMGFVMTSQLR